MTKIETLAKEFIDVAQKLEKECNAISISNLNSKREFAVNMHPEVFFTLFPANTAKFEISKYRLQFPYEASVEAGGLKFFTMLTATDIKRLEVKMA
jgi:hypothetical protein